MLIFVHFKFFLGLQQSPRPFKPIRFLLNTTGGLNVSLLKPPTEEHFQTQKFFGSTGVHAYPSNLKLVFKLELKDILQIFFCRDYIERAYRAIEGKEDHKKLEDYLKLRVEPLLKSGAVYAVNWVNFI